MAVITISRGSFSGGRMLAECAAARLGYRCIDRDVIVQKAVAYGVSQDGLRDALERPPMLLDRFRHTKYVYLTLIQAALAEEVKAGNTIYHGNAGHLLLRGVDHVMRTRIIAPLAFRLAAVQNRFQMTEDDGRIYIQKIDEDRQKWAHYLYAVDWRDASLYDLVLNLEHLNIEQACEIIAAMARQDCFKETPASRASIDDLALASRVQATLAVAPGTLQLEVDVSARAGSVVISGAMLGQRQADEIRAIAVNVPGVTDVNVELAAACRA
jgi:cytidylate kinase